jgi:hypothetical protein
VTDEEVRVLREGANKARAREAEEREAFLEWWNRTRMKDRLTADLLEEAAWRGWRARSCHA